MRIARVIGGLVLVGVLGGCAGVPAAAPSGSSPSATPPASASPTSTPSAAFVGTVLIFAETLALVDAEGTTVAEFGYFDSDPATVVAALSEAFGVDPVIGEQDGGGVGPDRVTYTWGGFELWDTQYETVSYPDKNAIYVVARTASVCGWRVLGAGQVSAGMSRAQVPATSFDPMMGDHEFDVSPVDPAHRGDLPLLDTDLAALSVSVSIGGADDLVSRILAPARNWGP